LHDYCSSKAAKNTLLFFSEGGVIAAFVFHRMYRLVEIVLQPILVVSALGEAAFQPKLVDCAGLVRSFDQFPIFGRSAGTRTCGESFLSAGSSPDLSPRFPTEDR
jgi:hypothetical protein